MISDSKLKIMLTTEDMKTYSLNCERLSYNNTETRRAFWNILDEAKQRTGFDAASDRVFVQVYPSRGGGCEMYVTKLGIRSADVQREEDDVRLRYKEEESVGNKASTDLLMERVIYRFCDINDVVEACSRLNEIGYADVSTLYTAFGGYFLSVVRTDETEILCEYGENVPQGAFDIYIGEYGRCICEKNATEIIGSFS